MASRRRQRPRIALVGDTHHPWMNWPCFRAGLKLIKDFQPDHIVQMGDAFDFYSWSRWDKSFNLLTPARELAKGRKDFERMWDALLTAAPKAKGYQIWGNHDDRAMKTVMSKAPELEAFFDFLDYKKLWRFDGVELQDSSKDELVIADVVFQHGHSKAGSHYLHNLMNTAVGHLHTGYTMFERVRGDVIWELNAGSMIDKKAEVFNYVNGKKFARYVNGLGLVDEHGPRFIPYIN